MRCGQVTGGGKPKYACQKEREKKLTYYLVEATKWHHNGTAYPFIR